MAVSPLPDNLHRAASLKHGLGLLRDHLAPFGVRDLVYGYMLQDRSFVRNDLVFVYTLPQALMDIYYEGGGLNNDPHAADMAAMTEPVLQPLKAVQYRDIGGRRVEMPFASAALEQGYTDILTCPGSGDDVIGIAGMTFYQEARRTAPTLDPALAQQAAIKFHAIMKRHGQLAGYFNVTDTEVFALAAMTEGKTADDLAQILSVTPRTIELRLQSIRKKLKAKTTVEAAYKALAYGVLPRH